MPAEGPRINDEIRMREVRVIVEDTGEQLGVILTEQALEMAQEMGLDLVEVAPTAKPPVCKIMNYGAFKFKKAKAAREAKKSSTKIEIKEMRFTPNTAENDIQVKVRKIKEFLEEDCRVIVSLKFKGRQKDHISLGRELLKKVIVLTSDVSTVENSPNMEDNKLLMTLVPKK